MLKKSRRITRRTFDSVRLSPLTAKNHALSLRFVCAGAKGHFSVVVSKTVSPRAVERNLLRRRVYALLEKKDLEVNGIVYIRSKITSFNELSQSLEKLLTAASLVCRRKA